MELKIANCANQTDFDAVAKLLLDGWKIATKVKNNGITGTQASIVYHLIKWDATNADDVAKAKEFLQVEKALETTPVLASGIADIDAMQFFDTETVPSKVATEGWRPLSKDHVYAKGAWLIKLKGTQTMSSGNNPATTTVPTGAGQ
jgi:hypothetical protein